MGGYVCLVQRGRSGKHRTKSGNTEAITHLSDYVQQAERMITKPEQIMSSKVCTISIPSTLLKMQVAEIDKNSAILTL